jgi:hypothetical protein
MNVQIEPHTLARAGERGTNGDEIKDVLENGMETPARGNRKGKANVYNLKHERLGKTMNKSV